jgi:hypothetical protein
LCSLLSVCSLGGAKLEGSKNRAERGDAWALGWLQKNRKIMLTHTTTNSSCHHSSAFRSLSVGRSAAPSKHGAAAFQSERSRLRSLSSVCSLGGAKLEWSKNRAKRGDARALKWPPFYKFTHNNQLK